MEKREIRFTVLNNLFGPSEHKKQTLWRSPTPCGVPLVWTWNSRIETQASWRGRGKPGEVKRLCTVAMKDRQSG